MTIGLFLPLTKLAIMPSSPSTSLDMEKDSIRATEHVKVTTSLYNEDVDVSEIDERKLIRKLDLFLIPWLSFLYLLCFLDRTSIGKYVFDFWRSWFAHRSLQRQGYVTLLSREQHGSQSNCSFIIWKKTFTSQTLSIFSL